MKSKKFGSVNTRLHYSDLTDKATWVYDNYNPCTIVEKDNGMDIYWIVDVCGDFRECESVAEINDFLENYYDTNNKDE